MHSRDSRTGSLSEHVEPCSLGIEPYETAGQRQTVRGTPISMQFYYVILSLQQARQVQTNMAKIQGQIYEMRMAGSTEATYLCILHTLLSLPPV